MTKVVATEDRNPANIRAEEVGAIRRGTWLSNHPREQVEQLWDLGGNPTATSDSVLANGKRGSDPDVPFFAVALVRVNRRALVLAYDEHLWRRQWGQPSGRAL